MKALISSLFIVMLVATLASAASAQHYYVYDGETFSVMLTTNTADTRVLKVQFSANGEWHDFNIIDFHDSEGSEEDGFAYIVLDGKNHKYEVDYYRTHDDIIGKDLATGESWLD